MSCFFFLCRLILGYRRIKGVADVPRCKGDILGG